MLVDAVGIDDRELGQGLFPVRDDLALDEPAGCLPFERTRPASATIRGSPSNPRPSRTTTGTRPANAGSGTHYVGDRSAPHQSSRLRWIALIAETGADMTQFPTAAHLASWAGVCPGHNESGYGGEAQIFPRPARQHPFERRPGHRRDGRRQNERHVLRACQYITMCFGLVALSLCHGYWCRG